MNIIGIKKYCKKCNCEMFVQNDEWICVYCKRQLKAKKEMEFIPQDEKDFYKNKLYETINENVKLKSEIEWLKKINENQANEIRKIKFPPNLKHDLQKIQKSLKNKKSDKTLRAEF